MNHKHILYNLDQKRLVFVQKMCNLFFLLGFIIGATIVI